MRSISSALLLLAVWATVASAQPLLMAGRVGDPYNAILYDNGGVIEVEIAIDQVPDLSYVSFALDLPNCSGLTLTNVSYGANPHGGDIETAVVVSFGGCQTLPWVVATLTFQSTGLDTCCYVRFKPPATPSGLTEAGDCVGNTLTAQTRNAAITPGGGSPSCGNPTVPSNPSPADGATGVPLSLNLYWDTSYPVGTTGYDNGALVHFGTDPNPPAVLTTLPIHSPYAIGPLAPLTTYYWKVTSCDVYGCTDGPVWSFTTADVVGAETSTWGRIKSLYGSE